MSTVGESERSIFKHTLLNKLAGQVAGVLTTPDFRNVSQVVFIDACAGAGDDNKFSGTSSPKIFARHVEFLYQKNKAVLCYFIEQDKRSAERLAENINSWSFRVPGSIFKVLCGDYRSEAIITRTRAALQGADCAFIYLDPNSADAIAMPDLLWQQLPSLTTFLCSLGCNASGAKRMGHGQERLRCFNDLLRLVNTHHEAVLVWLESDPSQWAYLLSIAASWRQKTEQAFAKLGKEWRIKWTWYRDLGFEIETERLLLDREEYLKRLDKRQQTKLF